MQTMEDKKIYDALDRAEKIAITLAKINKLFKARRKKQIKKDKKIYKLNKKTGILVNKKAKRQKVAKLHKRHRGEASSKEKK